MAKQHGFKETFELRGCMKMPALGLGTYAPKQDVDEVFNAVHAAVKVGYRHIDCAAIYRNERSVGQAIKKLIVEGTVERSDLFVVSKLWNTCHRPDLVRTSLKKSLEDLGMSYLDLYLMHWPCAFKEGEDFIPFDENGKVKYSDVDFIDTWKALEDCVDEGLVRNIGISNFNAEQIKRLMEVARIKPQTNQVEIHVHFSNSKLIDVCRQYNIIPTAYGPLGAPGNKNEKPPSCLEEPVVLQIAKAKNKTPAQVLLRCLLQRGISVVPKSVTLSRVTENFQVFDFELSDEEMQQLADLDRNVRLYDEAISIGHKYYPFNAEF